MPNWSVRRKDDTVIELKLEAGYSDESEAHAIFAALNPDNEGYVHSELRGNTLFFTVSADNAGTMKNTVDDLMACLKIAEDAVSVVKGE